MNDQVITAITVSTLPAGTGLSYTYDVINEKGVPVSTNQKGFFYVRDPAVKEKIEALFEAAKQNLSE